MARIPLAQIPNVPGLPDPVLTKYPDVRVDLSDMARRLQQGEIRQGSFDGPAEGLQAMGQAVGKTANVFQQLGERMAESKNQADLSRAENIMSEARAAHAQEIQSLPEDQWVSLWEQKYRPQIEQQLDALHLAPITRERVVPQLVHFDATTRSGLAYDALKQTAARDERDIRQMYDYSVKQGDFATADRSVDRLLAAHHISDTEAALMKQHVQDASQQRQIDTTLNANARSVYDDATSALHTNKSKLFPFLDGQPEKIARLHAQAKSLVQQQEVEAFHSAQDDVASGSTFEEIKRRYGAALPEHKLLILQKASHSLREWNPAVDGPAAEHLRADIANYRRDNDPDLNQLDALQNRIADFPVNKQGFLSTLLSQQYEKTAKPDKEPTAHDQQLAFWLSESNRLGQAGYLGSTGRSRKNFSLINDPQQSAAYGEKLQGIRIQLQDWSKQNPKATAEEWSQQFQKILKPYLDEHVSQAIAPEDLYDKHGGPISPQPTPVPVTHFSLGRDVGGPDPVQDANTNAGRSVAGPNLTPGAAAVNTSRYPLGTVFQDRDTGEVFLATDRHKNDDPNVVDLYQSPDRYQNTLTSRNLSVIGRVVHIPRNAEGLRKLLASLGNLPEGESAEESLTRLRQSNP